MSVKEEGKLTICEKELMEILSAIATRLQPRPTHVRKTRIAVKQMARQFAYDKGIARAVLSSEQYRKERQLPKL